MLRKSVLKALQSIFTKSADHKQAVTEASFRESHFLAKNKKPFIDNELFKEAMAITAETIFKDFKNKDEIKKCTPWCTALSCISDKEGRVTVRGRASTSFKGLVNL